MSRKATILKIVYTSLWVMVGGALAFLLISAAQHKEIKHCKGINITITGVSNNFFIDKKDVENIIKRIAGTRAVGTAIKDLHLREMENTLKQDIWIKTAELYVDNNQVLQVDVEEREPIARVFAINNHTFYIDSSLVMLPLSDKFSARVPVFTGFPSDTKVLSRKDSALLAGIRAITLHIEADSFLTAMIEQVDITPARTFEMLPKLGNQFIIFGDAKNIDKKFEKLKLFYKQVIATSGLGKYKLIDLQYNNQVVARIRGKEDIISDSLRTMQLMQAIAAKAAKQAADTVGKIAADTKFNTADSSLIQQSMERNEGE